MARKKISYERQAQVSLALALFGGLCTLVCAWIILDAFDWQTLWVTYNPKTLRLPAIGGTLLLALASSGAAFLVAYNSAGQRLNTRNKLSWTGFFVSAVVITLAMGCGVFFFFFRHAVTA